MGNDSSNWQIDKEKLEAVGVKPGVYEHFKGGEYLTLTAGLRMEQDESEESVGERIVIYVALYDHPKYGSNAIWDRSVEGFTENLEIDGKQLPRFRFVRDC